MAFHPLWGGGGDDKDKDYWSMSPEESVNLISTLQSKYNSRFLESTNIKKNDQEHKNDVCI